MSRPPAGTLNPRGEASGSRFRAGRPFFQRSVIGTHETGIRRQTTNQRRDDDMTTRETRIAIAQHASRLTLLQAEGDPARPPDAHPGLALGARCALQATGFFEDPGRRPRRRPEAFCNPLTGLTLPPIPPI